MVGFASWSIVFSLYAQGSSAREDVTLFQPSFEAMLAGNWAYATALLAEMKGKGVKLGAASLSRFVEMSQSSSYNANVLTGLRLFKDYGVDFRNDDGHLLTIVAVHDRWGEVTERLLQYGANPNKQWVNHASRDAGLTPLACAAMSKNGLVQAKLLLKYGALPDAFSDIPTGEKGTLRRHVSPLMLAARSRKPDFVRLLLNSKAKVNVQCPEDGMTALHIAAEFDNGEGIGLLLKNGARKSIRNKENETALDVAKRKKAKKAIAALSQ